MLALELSALIALDVCCCSAWSTGAYGIVWKATDRKSEETVALKKIFDAFQNATDAQRTFREVNFLFQMGGHENIVRLLSVLKADNDRDLYLIFEYMETDLHATIRANILEDIHKQYIMYQAFKALMYMHSAKLVHRDMKPANLLLNSDCLMKVADFGLARSLLNSELDPEDSKRDNMTDYVATRCAILLSRHPAHAHLPPPYGLACACEVTPNPLGRGCCRWYRAPEILLSSNKYGIEVDLWSLGCIFAEMIGGKPAFCGTSTLNQIEKIVEELGFPEEFFHPDAPKLLDSMYARQMLDNLKAEVPRQSKTLEQQKEAWRAKYPKAEEDAIDLLTCLLQIDPRKRLTATQGVIHPYCVQFHDAQTETTAGDSVKVNSRGIENDNAKKCDASAARTCLGQAPVQLRTILFFPHLISRACSSESVYRSTAIYRDAIYDMVGS